MTGAYAKEFERWLESKRDGSSKSFDSDDPDMVHNGDSEDEVDNISSVKREGLTGDAAPILSDDEDDDEFHDEGQSGVKDHFEEEPPILEPVPSMPNRKQSEKSVFHETSTTQARPSHCGKMLQPQSNSSVDSSVQKDVSTKDKIKFQWEKKEVLVNGDEHKMISDDHSSLKQSGNIFDKFNAMSEQADDAPPPLIPSPEALFTDTSSNASGDENFNVKIQSNSPDFCAMEADSTSEIPKPYDEDIHLVKKGKIEMTNSKSDVSIECDSTCMLGVSPNVASSGFALSIDIDDSATQSDNQVVARDTEDEVNESNSKTVHSNSLVKDLSRSEGKEEEHTNKSGLWDQECPTLEAAVNEEEKNKDIEHRQDSSAEEPPVLSVILPASVQSLRRKRHTIDTVENIGSSSKYKYKSTSPIRSEQQNDVNSLGPPNLLRQAETSESPLSHGEGKFVKMSKKRKHSGVKKGIHVKSKSRSRSYSFTVDMSKFVKRSSELSHLQSRMHKLVSLLFPQIEFELSGMSPESIHFENVLIDLASSLRESSVDESEKFALPGSKVSIMDCADMDTFSLGESDCRFRSDISQPQNSSFSPAPSHSENTTFTSRHSMKSKEAPFSYMETNCSSDISAGESVIPQLSQLSLTPEKEKILKRQPSVVIKTNVYEASKSFTRLACDVLQLLLPDLTISLFDALGDSYQDLLNLIDSVILSNST